MAASCRTRGLVFRRKVWLRDCCKSHARDFLPFVHIRRVKQRLGAHCVTLNPYMGEDTVQPFIEDPAKGAFVLCKVRLMPFNFSLELVELF